MNFQSVKLINTFMNCPVCNQNSEIFTTAVKYYSASYKNCKLFHCERCSLFYKENLLNSLYSDFENDGVKNYNTNSDFEQGYFLRFNFLKFIYNFTVSNLPKTYSINNWLDYGSGMGYLLFYLKDFYTDLAAIEIAASGRDIISDKGIPAYPVIEDLPDGKKFDVISSIDSFYYSLEPVSLINSFNYYLKPNGYLVVRISLRNFLIRFNKFVGRIPDDSLRDHFVGYSYKGFLKLFSDNGFEKVASSFKEEGKLYYSYKMKVLNTIVSVLHFLSFGLLNFHTGVTIIYKKNSL